MIPYADYAFYRGTYGGRAIGEEDFPGLALRASSFLQAATGRLSDQATGDDLEAVRMITCALAEVCAVDGRMVEGAASAGGALQSETVGSWSRTYATNGISTTTADWAAQRRIQLLYEWLGGRPFFARLFKAKAVRPCSPM